MMETRASGTWTAPNGERADVTLQALPDGDGRFGGVYVTAATALSSGRPSSAIVAVTVEDEEGNAYDYTPVALNMGLCAKLPDRFFAPSYPTNNAPMPSRLKWTVTGVRMMDGTGAWQSCTGDPVTLDYYPAGRFGASGELLTQYPWRWWWGEDCEAPVPMSRELIPTAGNPLPVHSCDPDYGGDGDPLLEDPRAFPFLISLTLRGTPPHTWGWSLLDVDDGYIEDYAAFAQTYFDSYSASYAEFDGWRFAATEGRNSMQVAVNLLRDKEPLLGTIEFSLGLFSNMRMEQVAVEPRSTDRYLLYDKIELVAFNDGYTPGFATSCGWDEGVILKWLNLRVTGLRRNPACEKICNDFIFSLNWENVDKLTQAVYWPVMALGFQPPALNPYTNNYAPFVLGGGACRDNILASPKHRGRLTQMRLPNCQLDYYVKWWDNDGTCYVLPYSVAGETVEAQQDGTPLYEATRTLRLVSPSLTEEERKDALTVAESPRVAVKPYGGEWTFARLKDYSTTWELGEEGEANVELEIIVNYGKSDD